jgi:hypothetical protein
MATPHRELIFAAWSATTGGRTRAGPENTTTCGLADLRVAISRPQRIQSEASAAASSFLAAHLKSPQDYPPRQAADSLSMKKAIEKAMQLMDSPNRGNQ